MRQAIQKPPDRPVYHLPGLSGQVWPPYLQGVKDWWGDTGSEPPGHSQIHSDITDYHHVRDRNNTSERRRVYVQINIIRSDKPAARTKRFCECFAVQSRLSAIITQLELSECFLSVEF